ncbi:unnamed protein product [Gemmata massiliana]|uniref:VanZ-like domain-containing protein n=1 Tax=Gemmata massiliana TaxID=1210884 RepID=A0A6P2D475_9BACT|nr:unnamed protein product [Gemmata massiliana]
MPVVVFVGPRVVTARDYLVLDLFVLVGLCVYEVAQIWMPRRTFSWDDIGASVLGAGIAAVLGFALFLRPVRRDN